MGGTGGGAAPTGAGVVVTRDEADDGPLSTLLADRGLRVIHWPTIRTAPPDDDGPLRRSAARLADFDWAVFTSRRAVEALAKVAAPPADVRVAAVGESTAEALVDAGWTVELVPEEQTGRALVAALAEAGVGAGSRVFFPASAIARDEVPDGLERLGAEVVQVAAYRTEAAPLDAAACRSALDAGVAEIVTFTSPSTVHSLEAALGPDVFGLAVRATRAVCIGPTTAEAAEEAGWSDVVVADPHSLEGLADRVAMLAGRDSIQEAM